MNSRHRNSASIPLRFGYCKFKAEPLSSPIFTNNEHLQKRSTTKSQIVNRAHILIRRSTCNTAPSIGADEASSEHTAEEQTAQKSDHALTKCLNGQEKARPQHAIARASTRQRLWKQKLAQEDLEIHPIQSVGSDVDILAVQEMRLRSSAGGLGNRREFVDSCI